MTAPEGLVALRVIIRRANRIGVVSGGEHRPFDRVKERGRPTGPWPDTVADVSRADEHDWLRRKRLAHGLPVQPGAGRRGTGASVESRAEQNCVAENTGSSKHGGGTSKCDAASAVVADQFAQTKLVSSSTFPVPT